MWIHSDIELNFKAVPGLDIANSTSAFPSAAMGAGTDIPEAMRVYETTDPIYDSMSTFNPRDLHPVNSAARVSEHKRRKLSTFRHGVSPHSQDSEQSAETQHVEIDAK